MQVHYGFDDLPHIDNPVLTIGTFDGVHVGHQQILNGIREVADRIGGETVLFTFHPHPRLVLQKDASNLLILQTQQEKIDKLARFGLDHLIIYPFTTDFSNIKAEDFVQQFLIDKLNVHTIVVGYDHQFGKNREGSLEQLQQLSKSGSFSVIEIPAREIDEVNVSSTKIREALTYGNIEIANRYLNEAYELSGIVTKGKQLGRTIGYPTANISILETHKLIPPTGVYAVEVRLNGRKLFGMLNIGYRPTVSTEPTRTIEVHIFDFNEDIYDAYLSVRLLQKTRNEQRFESIDALKTQLQHDEMDIRRMFLLEH